MQFLFCDDLFSAEGLAYTTQQATLFEPLECCCRGLWAETRVVDFLSFLSRV